jgi:hypothetical protein
MRQDTFYCAAAGQQLQGHPAGWPAWHVIVRSARRKLMKTRGIHDRARVFRTVDGGVMSSGARDEK